MLVYNDAGVFRHDGKYAGSDPTLLQREEDGRKKGELAEIFSLLRHLLGRVSSCYSPSPTLCTILDKSFPPKAQGTGSKPPTGG